MARVHQKTAAKDYPAQGIKKGDVYFTWKTRMTVGKSYVSQVHRSLTRPLSTSQSAFEQALAQIDASLEGVEDSDGLRAVAEEIRSLGEEEQGKFDNMPEGLQQGETGQLLEERAQGCDAWADDLDTFADELDTALEEIADKRERFDALAIAWADHEEDPDANPEPDDADPREDDYDQEEGDALAQAVEQASNARPF